MSVSVGGFVEPGFEGVRDAFAANFEMGEVGAGFSLYVEGRKVVDLWGGAWATGEPYDDRTLQVVFSTTKGALAAAAHLLVDRGLLDLDAPAATYWPEFAQAGKEDVPVRWLLSHKTGVPVIDRKLTLDEILAWKPVIEALEVQEPIWEPGTKFGYHGLTYGWLVGELIRRIDGRSPGVFFAEEIARPLGLEFYINLPPEHESRVSPLLPPFVPPEMMELMARLYGPDSLIGRMISVNGVFELPATWNEPKVHQAEVPAVNGITNASSLARLYAGLIGGVEGYTDKPLISPETMAAARTPQTEGADAVVSADPALPATEWTFGLGFMLSSPSVPFGGASSFGHFGAGGSFGFADSDHGIACGYTMNQMMQGLAGDPRSRPLIEASYKAVGATLTHI